LTCPDSGR